MKNTVSGVQSETLKTLINLKPNFITGELN